ncbi:MAG TPA: hypothetical protein VH969_14535 [Actinophytocola sp.]|jgi:hypothetical protein|uniref:hypothetical protein n=1 Tax=Actinophytocola sp. TaxID=1872138 RepID=UPI002F95C04A
MNTNPNTNRRLLPTTGLLVAVAATLSLVTPAAAVADDSPWDRGTHGGRTAVSRDLADGTDCGTGTGTGTGGDERDDDSPWD